MSKFQVGDKIVRTRHRSGDFEEGKPYTVSEVNYSCRNPILRVKEKGPYWYDATCFNLYQEPTQKTFNPKSGDIIVTEGEGNWVCVDKSDPRFIRYQDYDFSGIQGNNFQCWMSNGNPYIDSAGYDPSIDDKYNIKEIIPAASNNSVTIPQENPDLSFKVKTLELENQMLRMLLRREGVDV